MKNFMEHSFDVQSIAVACYVPPGGGTPVHKDRPQHGLVFHTDGKRHYVFDQQTVFAGSNDIVYLPKNSSYVVTSEAPGGCYAINFEIHGGDVFLPFAFKTKHSAGFLDCFKQAEAVWRTQSAGYDLKCKAELYQILYQLRKEYELGYLPKASYLVIHPAIEYIHQEYTNDNISIPSLAALCGISETLFRKTFQKATGLSPLKYVNALKISRAKELLLSRMYTVSEAAFLSGYHDEAYFSREFKKAVGVAPSEYK